MGMRGTVIGIGSKPNLLHIQWESPGGEWDNIEVDEISSNPPVPFPGGFKKGNTVYHKYGDNGAEIDLGMQGTVMGIGDTPEELWVNFGSGSETKAFADIKPSEISLVPPPIPGGFEAGDIIYSLFSNKNPQKGAKEKRKVHINLQGRVVGAGRKPHSLEIEFDKPGGEWDNIPFQLVGRKPVPIPGGFKKGDTVYHTYPETSRFPVALEGKVMGIGNSAQLLCVQFHKPHYVDGQWQSTWSNIKPTKVSRIPGGLVEGETVYSLFEDNKDRQLLSGWAAAVDEQGEPIYRQDKKGKKRLYRKYELKSDRTPDLSKPSSGKMR